MNLMEMNKKRKTEEHYDNISVTCFDGLVFSMRHNNLSTVNLHIEIQI